MRDADPGGARYTLGAILLGAAFAFVAWHFTTLAVITAALTPWLIAACLLYRTRAHRAVLDAEVHKHRAEVLAGHRHIPALRDVLLDGPPDEHVGHTDREIVLDRLGDRYATGHLDASEFETRSTEAIAARTRAQLADALRDLP